MCRIRSVAALELGCIGSQIAVTFRESDIAMLVGQMPELDSDEESEEEGSDED